MSKHPVAVAVVAVLAFTTRLAAADEAAPKSKDRDAAFTLSAGSTVASIGLVVASRSTDNATLTGAALLTLLITPSAGEIYAGKVFTAGMGIRLVSAGVGLLGVVELTSCTLGCNDFGGSGVALLLVGALGYTSGILYDIATAGSAVDDYNQRLHVRVTPTVIPASSGPAVGLVLGGSF